MVEYFPPSEVGSVPTKHFDAMFNGTEEQPEGKSFALPKADYLLPLLRDIADLLSVGRKLFIVIEHEDVFEVRRLRDGTCKKLFNKYLNGETSAAESELADTSEVARHIKKVCREFLTADIEKVNRYESKLTRLMQQKGILSKSYIQRRCGSMASFRRYRGGSTKAVTDGIDELQSQGFLSVMDETIAKDFYDTTATMLEINLENAKRLDSVSDKTEQRDGEGEHSALSAGSVESEFEDGEA